MVSSRRCPTCVGSGEIMGGGFMTRECPNCQGDGNLYEKPVVHVEPEKIDIEKVEIDRRSKSYRESISKIMDSENVSRDEAVKMFDEEYAKI